MFNVYVIELNKDVMSIPKFKKVNPNYDPTKPCAYVGQTAKAPEARFQQHLSGQRANRFVEEFGQRLRPKLYERHNPIKSRPQAEAREQWLAEMLRKKSYGVWWN